MPGPINSSVWPRVATNAVGGTPSTGPFDIPFPFYDDDDLTVFVDGVEITEYTIAQPDEFGVSGNTVTLNSPVSDVDVVVISDTQPVRTTGESFVGSEMSQELDRVIAREQEREERGIGLALDGSVIDAEGLRIANLGTPTGEDDAVTKGYADAIAAGLPSADPATLRAFLDLEIGIDVQAYDAGLASIAGLTTAANKMIYTTGSDTYAVADLTAAGLALLDDASASAQRTTLGLGSAAVAALLDEDDFASNSDTAAATQQSIRKHIRDTAWLSDGGEVATTSGTTIDFTGISDNTREIHIIFENVSTDGTDPLLIQIGDSGGIEATGYLSGSSSASNNTSATTGFVVRRSNASDAVDGLMVLTKATSQKWVAQHGTHVNANGLSGGGFKQLSDTLTQLRLTTASGDTFDAGSINIRTR